jgi:integrase
VAKAASSTINQRLAVGRRLFLIISGRWRRTWSPAIPRPASPPFSWPHDTTEPVHQSVAPPIARRPQRRLPRDAAIIELPAGAVSAGLRVGELLQLHREDIALGDRAGWVIIRKGKHGHYPEVPLTRDVRQALADYLATDLPGEGEVPQRSL